jgi:hypothetical protein
LKSLKNTLFSNKSLLTILAVVLLIAGSSQNPMFFILPLIYLTSISAAYFIGAKINDYGINAAYNWSIKWALFVFFLYLTATFMQNVFISAMLFFIFINTVLNPTMFVKKEASI